MSELTKALIQFHKDVDKIEKNARAKYGKFADLSQRPQHRHPSATQERSCHLTQTFLEDSLVTTLRHVPAAKRSAAC